MNKDIIERQEATLDKDIELARQEKNLEMLEKFYNLKLLHEANEAKKAYHKAMAEFKAKPPKIDKDKKVGYKTDKGNVGYSHASLANITDKINSELSKYGLSASWPTKQNNGDISVTCKITHIKGHSEETTLTTKPDKSGSKNDIQALGSAITYLQRYTLLALTGLATYDQDDDGRATGNGEKIDDKQLSQLCDLFDNYPIKKSKFLAVMKIEKIEDLPKKDFQRAIELLNSVIAQKKKK